MLTLELKRAVLLNDFTTLNEDRIRSRHRALVATNQNVRESFVLLQNDLRNVTRVLEEAYHM